MLDHGFVREVFVAVHHNLADGDPLSLLHVEDDSGPAGARCQLNHLDGRGVISLVLVQGVDASAALFDRIAVQRAAFSEMDPAFHLTLGEPVYTAYGPFLQQWPLFHTDEKHELSPDDSLSDDNIVELAGAEERGDGALNIPVVDRLVNDEAGSADDLRRGEPCLSFGRDAVHCWRAWFLSLEDSPPAEQERAGQKGLKKSVHRKGVEGEHAGPPEGGRRA